MALVGPVIAVVLIAVVLMAMLYALTRRRSRRAARPSRATAPERVTAPAVKPAPPPTRIDDHIADDYGLLATAAVARTHADALLVKEHLRTAGIRSTLANAPDGQVRVLVFGDEVVRARRLAG